MKMAIIVFSMQKVHFKGQLLSIVFFTITFLLIFKVNMGYTWVWNTLVNESLKVHAKYKNLTLEQRQQMKYGVDAAALYWIKEHTSSDDTILFPPMKILLDTTSEYRFLSGLGGIKSRNWALHFLYPRTLVYADELNLYTQTPKVSHIFVFQGWGVSCTKNQVNPTFDVVRVDTVCDVLFNR